MSPRRWSSIPKLVEAHELLANLALEDSDPAQAVKEADAALQISADALDAMAIRAAVELLADRSPDAWIQKILQVNPTYGQGYALMAFHLVINRRYEEGVAYYRKAIDRDPQLWSARSQLGHQSDAPRAGGRAATAARDGLQQRLPRRGHGQQPAAARQLQELRGHQERASRPRSSSTRRKPICSSRTSSAC